MTMRNKALAIALTAASGLGMANAAVARDTISIVGSSTVYPFATVVAERFGTNTEFNTPKLESTGSGGGMKLFCAGIGTQHPDITNASRRMKPSEFELCQSNGVEEITEFRIGSDGIVIASSNEAENLDISLKQLFLALGAKIPVDGKWVANPNKNWSDVDSSLPNKPIRVMGPPPTSGTRDSFNELALAAGCDELPETADLSKDDHKANCESIREDGAFIEAGENDNLIVQKLISDHGMYGVFGFSFLEENADRLQAAKLNGMVPTAEDIAADKYPVARSLFFYVKKAHIGVVPGIQEYINEFTSNGALGANGYLKDVGLIIPPREQLANLMDKAENLTNLTIEELQ
ncbi:substrate-binding domain-containing protein [Marinobacterium lutimaris]|uniref:Phosphate ABC transporter substrate-binding protein, PhoT family n=1 Tax=Marinobacterium lutimaris TaxID=568106 RepID=A0A1H6DES2_9GAMM|nr:substrate-binding domain-containing protein [Marinobacterium lutimaris]SEG83799.1 phosphate ABC transporter substrate-binding protein, PhoT family [Marinobacterium lutimaris]